MASGPAAFQGTPESPSEAEAQIRAVEVPEEESAAATAKDLAGKGKSAPVKPLIDTEEKLLGTVPTITSIATDISQILQPYMEQMAQLGPEYQKELEYLGPYLNQTGAGAPQTFEQMEATSKAQESPTGNTAVNAADAKLGAAVNAMQPPGFWGADQQLQGYIGSIPYQAPEQAAAGYQKYLETYGQLQPTETGWSPAAVGAEQYLSGSAGGGPGGLGTNIASAAAGAKAAQNLGITPSTQAGGQLP